MRHLTWPARTEPSIYEVLSDPIVRRLMTSDNVRDDDLIDLIESVRHKLAVRNWRSDGPRFQTTPVRDLSENPGNRRPRQSIAVARRHDG